LEASWSECGRGETPEMKVTKEEREAIEKIFEIPYAEEIYGANIHSYIKEVERIKEMTEEELRREYPTAFYWLDKWDVSFNRGKSK